MIPDAFALAIVAINFVIAAIVALIAGAALTAISHRRWNLRTAGWDVLAAVALVILVGESLDAASLLTNVSFGLGPWHFAILAVAAVLVRRLWFPRQTA